MLTEEAAGELLRELLQNDYLSDEEREKLKLLLRWKWFSDNDESLPRDWQKQSIASGIEEILRLDAKSPVAIILGEPGSGKSTTLHWLALQMAKASLDSNYRLDKGLMPVQIPVLLDIKDYLERLIKNESLSFRDFFKEHFAKEDPKLPDQLVGKLVNGHCLLLIDNLDMIPDSLRKDDRVAASILNFIFNYSQRKNQMESTTKSYNRFIITSRSAGYEPGTFSRYTPYTLLDFGEEQIEQFLSKWFPAVEGYYINRQQFEKGLSPDQRRKRLLEIIQKDPGIKRLAFNPFMLTFIALLYRRGTILPNRRVDLYKVITKNLLDSSFNEDQHQKFTGDDVDLAKRLLANMAYQVLADDAVFTNLLVKKVISETINTNVKQSSNEIRDAIAKHFFKKLLSSGLLVMIDDDPDNELYSFTHQTFQEYFAAWYLLNLAPEELKQFTIKHFHLAKWREPFLLAIAYKSAAQDYAGKEQANELIKAILEVKNDYDEFLKQGLLFAARSVVDCKFQSISEMLQQNLANQLFDLYGDSFGMGHYTQLRQEIEDIALLWLRGQGSRNGSDNLSPLIQAWQKALCNVNLPLRQEGAVGLLASLAPNLSSCSQYVRLALIPSLIQLADLQDLPCRLLNPNINIKDYLPQPPASTSSRSVEDYAYITLRLLDATGPAGGLHQQWVEWHKKQPELLERLTQHSEKLNYLLTPAAIPNQIDISNEKAYCTLVEEWKEDGWPDRNELQTKLLKATNTARYPHAYLLKQLLDNELASTSVSWHEAWNSLLREEMKRGRSATYQLSLSLRLLLAKKGYISREIIDEELMNALSEVSKQQEQALSIIFNIYYHNQNISETRYLRPSLGRTPLTGERTQASLRGRPRSRLGNVGSGNGCLRGRPRGRLGTFGSSVGRLRGRPRRLGATQGAGATL